MAQFPEDFNRTNENPATGFTTVSGFASVKVESNGAASATASAIAFALQNAASGVGANQFSQIVIAEHDDAADTFVAPTVRGASGGATGYALECCRNNGSWTSSLDRLSDFASLASENVTTWGAGDTITLLMRGAAINTFRNGAVLLSVTDSTTASGIPGLALAPGTSTTNVRADSLLTGDLPIGTPVAGSAGSAASGNITPGDPGSWATGDIGVLLAHVSDRNAMTVDAAWQELAQGNGGGTTSRIGGWWFRYAGSVPSLLITHSGGQSPVGFLVRIPAANVPAGKRLRIVGVSAITGGTDASIEHASVPVTDDFQLALFCNGAADDNARTTPAGMTAIQTSLNTAGTPDGSVSMMVRDYMNGSSMGTQAITQAAADPWASFTVLIGTESIPSVLGRTRRLINQLLGW